MATPPNTEPVNASCIRDVWAYNLREEFKKIRCLARNGFNHIAVDTEFPGTPVRPVGVFDTPASYLYEMLRVNCNVLKLIQCGFTLMDKDGNLPAGICTWQFNFKFNLKEDMYSEESIDLLVKAGVQFYRMYEDGVDTTDFSELLITSGLVLIPDDVRWISFHSGYDFGYLLRILMGKDLPESENVFFESLKTFFPQSYDIKYLLKSCRGTRLNGGLQEVADVLNLKRVGLSHQAGSDSLLTGMIFFTIKSEYFDNVIDETKYNCRLYGIEFQNYNVNSRRGRSRSLEAED